MSKQNISLLAILLLIVFYAEYEFFDSKDYKLPSKIVEEFDANIFKMYSQEYNASVDANPFWGFAKEIVVSDDVNETNTSTYQTEVTQEEGKNVLCISASCFRLLGIYHKGANLSITLYNKDLKEKIKAYSASDTLQDGIVVDTIHMHEVILKDVNSSREWHFKIFDVNQTKYKPKENQE